MGFQASSLLACSDFLFGFRYGPYLGGGINTLLIAGLLWILWREHLRPEPERRATKEQIQPP